MSERIRIGLQTELSNTPYSLVRTNASNEQEYLAPGTNNQILTIVAGVPTWSTGTGATGWTITDGTNSQAISIGDTLTVTASNGMSATVSATDTLTLAARLSTDAGNDLVFGGDGGLFFSANNLVTGATWDDATNTLVLTLDSGATANVPILDVVSAFLADFVVSGNSGTDTINNHETLSVLGGTGFTTTVTANTITITANEVTEHFSSLTSGTTITLANSTTNAAVIIATRNGVVQWSGTPADYSISGTTLTVPVAFGVSGGAAATGETFSIRYRI
jgi:hypothetical protein